MHAVDLIRGSTLLFKLYNRIIMIQKDQALDMHGVLKELDLSLRVYLARVVEGYPCSRT